ncbi:Uncharacterized protein TCAP_02026 [Tolypocladium capitatum]|uniref:Uncharacterized protein n=1 Tax=Tolypocladium capitatum TaxID=45235 RepID=A0A2K3QKJ3_9HYPO|nr:Uncharacterized protein TCAP_02026 [Tolypocladium capitatum]
MAIRDRFRRALRKSDSETSSLHNAVTTTSTLSKVFTFGTRDRGNYRDKSKENEKKKAEGGRTKPSHPSQRPLTLQNLEHQEMLGQFTMTFGASNPGQIERLSFCGVSPCCTRPSSVVDFDGGHVSPLSALSIAETPRRDSARQ